MKKTSKILAMLLSFVMIISFATAGFAEISLPSDKAEADLRNKVIDFDSETSVPTTFITKLSGNPSVTTEKYRGTSGKSMKLVAGDRVWLNAANKSGSIREGVTDNSNDLQNVKAVEIKYYFRFTTKPNQKKTVFTDTFNLASSETGVSMFTLRDDTRIKIGETWLHYLAADTWHEMKRVCDLVNNVICFYINNKLVYTRTGVEFATIRNCDISIASTYDGAVYIDDFSVVESNEYIMEIDNFETSDTDSIQNSVKNIDVSLRGFPYVDSFITKGSDNGIDFYAIGNVSEQKTIVNKASLPKYLKVFGYDDNGNLVAESALYDTADSSFAKSRSFVFAKDSWSETETNYFNYDDTYFAACAKIEATTDASATETLNFASPIVVDENTPRYITARASVRFADKNSEKNVLILKAEDSNGNPVEIPYMLLGVNSAGTAALKTSTGTTLARNDKLADVTRHWNITTVIDIKDNVAYFFEGTTCHNKVNFEADIAKITGIEFSAEQTEANTALMYIDNIEVSQFDIDGEFNLGNTEFFVDDVKLDTSITSEGAATGKLSVASNGSKQSAKVIAVTYNDGSVESVEVYDLDFAGVLNKTYDLDFGTVAPGYVLKTFVWEAGTGLVPVRLPDILGNN